MSGRDRFACTTCGDAAEEMEVLAVDATLIARCRAQSGEEVTVDAALVGAPAPGDVLLVHAGAALAKLGEPAS